MGKIADPNLTDKQAAFVTEYLANGFNGTRAAVKAGYGEKGAYNEACRQLRKVEVAAAIKARLDTEGITPQKIKVALAEIAFGGDIAQAEGFLSGTKLSELRKQGVNTQLIKSVRVSQSKDGAENRAVEMYDRLAALEKLAKVYAMMTERVDMESRNEHVFPGLTNAQMELLAKHGDGPKE